ncbi:MAG: hypothetical protein ABIH67_03575 [Candidatus Uhrbacteria bacterium]
MLISEYLLKTYAASLLAAFFNIFKCDRTSTCLASHGDSDILFVQSTRPGQSLTWKKDFWPRSSFAEPKPIIIILTIGQWVQLHMSSQKGYLRPLKWLASLFWS